MEKNMSDIQPNTLTASELERMVYMNQGTLPAHWTEEIMRRFVEMEVKPTTPDPRQLSLF
tara:strand:+ start:1004 stop:1183 length:180 start_codon:yes stop_codon:yes gene_type:complete